MYHPHPGQDCVYNKFMKCVLCGESKMKCKQCGADFPDNIQKRGWYVISFTTQSFRDTGWVLGNPEVNYDSEYSPLFECSQCETEVTRKQAKKLDKLVY